MPNFETSELTKALVRYLSSHDKGTRLTYSELSNLVGEPIHSRSPNLVSARKILQRDYNAVWGCVIPKIGVFRLTDAEIADRQSTWYLAGARNKLRAGADQADVVEIEELDIGEQSRFATSAIIREIAREALSKATQRRIERAARGTSNDLPVFSAVEWMISLSPKRSKNA